MLTGVFLFLFGVGFGVNSLSLVFFFTPLFVLFNVWELRQIEEPELIRRLGDEYVEYRKQTPMFIPRIGRSSKTRWKLEERAGLEAASGRRATSTQGGLEDCRP
jgi:hypothetical protein